jgi:hypothetical protein
MALMSSSARYAPYATWFDVKVVEGLDVLKKMESVPVDSEDCPRQPVVIADCGQV